MDIFMTLFCVLSGLCGLLMVYTRNAMLIKTSAEFSAFQRVYLTGYLLAMSGDWLQGPHVYALYQSYGLSTHNIQLLFIIGFGANMLVGTVLGSFADKYGRRASCVLYGVLYSASCITKHYSNFWVLMAGRLLGGTATSILFSAFESWLICEHNQRGFDKDMLSHIFSVGVLGNSVVAIISGLVSQWLVDLYGFVAPFDMSLAVLAVMTVFILLTWTENYGDSNTSLTQITRSAIQAIRSDKKILYLGLVQALFEGTMYLFVLEWTPALTPLQSDITGQKSSAGEQKGAIPHGIIFSAFMVAVMFGSYIFKILFKFSSPDSFLRFVLGLSAVSLFLPAISQNQTLVFLCFLVFETCVGIFWPSIGTMRGQYIPETTRATIMTLFRIPLNFIVILMLLQSLSLQTIFLCCATFLSLAAACQGLLHRLTSTRLQIPLAVRRDHLASPVKEESPSALETNSLKAEVK